MSGGLGGEGEERNGTTIELDTVIQLVSEKTTQTK